MAISRRTRTVGTFASGGLNSTVTLPTGATTGDSILLALATVGTTSIAKPSDWTSVYSASIGPSSQIHLEVWSAPYSAGLTKNLGTNVSALAAWACQAFFLASATVTLDTSAASTNTTNNTTLPTGGPTPTQSGDTEELVYAWNSSGTISSFATGSAADGASQANSTTISVGFGLNSTASLTTSADTAFAQTLSGSTNRKVGVGVNILATFPPNIPSSSAASGITETGFSANWSASATDATHSDAAGYFLDVATDSGFVSLVTGYNNKDVANVTTSAVTGLSAGVAYWYRVRAYNLAATSGNSSSQNPTTTTLTAWVQYARFEVPLAATGSQTAAPSLLTSGPTQYAPVFHATFTVAPALVSRAPTVFAPASINQITHPALAGQSPTNFDPKLNQITHPALDTRTPTVYGPTVSVAISPALVTTSGPTEYVPALLPGPFTLTPAMVTRTPTVYSAFAAGAQILTPALVTRAPTAYAPAALNLTLRPARVSGAQTPYLPVIFPGPTSRTVALVSTTPTVFAPASVNQIAHPGLVSTATTVYAPTRFNQTIHPALVSGAQTAYAPALNQQLAPALDARTPTAFTPFVALGTAVSAEVTFARFKVPTPAPATPALVSSGPTVFAPSAGLSTGAQTVALALVPATGAYGTSNYGEGFFGSQLGAPQFNFNANPARITRSPVIFGPAIFPRVGTIAPARVTRTPTAFGQVVITQTIHPARVTPTFNGIFAPTLVRGVIILAPALVVRTPTLYAPAIRTPAQIISPKSILPAGTWGGGGWGDSFYGTQLPPVVLAPGVAVPPIQPALVTSGPVLFLPKINQLQPALVGGTPTLYVPVLNQVLSPARVGADTVYVPLFNSAANLFPLLVSRTATASTPVLNQQLKPARVSSIPTVYEPILNAAIHPASVIRAATVFTVLFRTANSLSPTRASSTPAVYAPAVNPGPFTVTPALDARTPAVNAPVITQGVNPARVGAPAVYAPTFTTANSLSPALVSRTPTVFAPVLVPGAVTVTPALVARVATAPSPSMLPGATSLAVPRVAGTQTVFAPTLVQRVRPARVTRTPVAYSPSSVALSNIIITLNRITSIPAVYPVQIVLPPPAVGTAIYYWPLGPGTAVPGGNAPAPGVAAGTPWEVGAGVAVAERT